MSDSHTSELGFTALVPLNGAAGMVPDAIGRAFAASSPRASLAIDERASGDSRQALDILTDGQRIVCALFDGPAPEPDISRAAKQSVFWRAAAQEIAGHAAFLALAAVGRPAGRRAARRQAAALTRMLAALCKAMPACAVLWRDADTLSPPGRLIRAARELDSNRWPIDVWIGCRVLGDDAAAPSVVSLSSRGVAAFLGFEIEVPPWPAEQKDKPLRILYGAAGALLSRADAAIEGLVVEVRGERPAEYRIEIGRAGDPRRARLVPVAPEIGGLAAPRPPG